MNKKQRKIHNLRRKVRRNFASNLTLRTDSQLEQASVWYVDEGTYCAEIGAQYGLTQRDVAVLYAATSPRQRLATNRAMVVMAASTGAVHGMPCVRNAVARAFDIINEGGDPLDALNPVTGRKTYNFARALVGDPEAVVVDVWMMRAAGFPEREDPTKLQYDAIEHVTRSMARDMGLEPRTLQALLWIIVRGGAA